MDTKQLLDTFYAANPGTDLLRMHPTDLDKIKLSSGTGNAAMTAAETGNAASATEQLKQVARVVRLHPDAQNKTPLTTTRIAEIHDQFNGMASAHHVAKKSKDVFVDQHAATFGSAETAAAIHDNAVGVTNNVSNLTAAIHNLTTPLAKAMTTTSVSDDVTEYFQQLPGYQDLFGGLNYCDCSECKSVVGPAAYLVDLLRIIRKYVTEPNAATLAPIPEMAFDYRRPDLPLIELTCENTNTIIPYLQVIIERLEHVLEKSWGITEGNAEAVYQKLAASYYPFNLPYLQPLSSIRIYLGQLKTSLAAIYETLQVGGTGLVTEQLGTTPEGWSLLTTPVLDPVILKTYYGVDDTASLSKFTVFTTQTNLLVTQVQDLLYQNLSENELTKELNAHFFINAGLAKTIEAGNNGTENTIDNLTPAALDQVNRFLRLAQLLGWSFDDLDWALHALNNGTPVINETVLSKIPAFRQLMAQTNFDANTLSGLLFDLKTYGTGNDPNVQVTPFDIVFNTGRDVPYRPQLSETQPYALNSMYTDKPWKWTVGSQTGKNPTYAQRLSSSLGISQSDLQLLGGYLFTTTETDLNVPALSALARHVKLAATLGFTIADYLIFLVLNGHTGATFTLGQLSDLFDAAAQTGAAQLGIADMNYVVNAVESPTVNVLYHADQAVSWLNTLPLLVTSSATDLVIARTEKLTKLYQQVGAFFGTTPTTATAILGLLKIDPLNVFLATDHAAALENLGLFSRWLVFMQKTGTSEVVLTGIAADGAVYGIADTTKLTFASLLNVLSFNGLINAFGDVNNRFTKYMSAVHAGDAANAAKILSEATGWDKGTITALTTQLTAPDSVARLLQLQTAFGLLALTGLGLDSLNALKGLSGKGAADWDVLSGAEESLLGAIQARYNAGSGWDQFVVQINGLTGSSKRDALMPAAIFVLRTAKDPVSGKPLSTAWISNARDLHDYLLIDVEMSSDAQISYVKEALNAAQLYLTRCRSKLEPGIEKLPIPDVWWEWMMNYRIWEANRQIFLYPENYLDPAYRSTKTALFSQLENDLKQNDITAENVTAAYTKYLEGFAELAKLVHVDAYYCNVSDATRNDQPTLFLFARTSTDPYTYYYITRESEGTWSEWTKIDLAINAAYVTPVYAFNKLFLFWVERSTTVDKNPTPGQATATIEKASIKYSFYNFQSQWVPAQSLVTDYIIAAAPSDYRNTNSALFPDAYFDPKSLWWNKVYPLKIEQDSYWEIANGGNRFEQLVIAYGPMIDTTAAITLPVNNDRPVSTNPAVRVFEDRLYRVRQDFSYATHLGYKGQLPIFHPVVLNDNLDATYLVNPDEMLFFSEDSPYSNKLFTPQIDATSGQLNLISTDRTIYDNAIAQQILYPSATFPGTAIDDNSFISDAAGINATGSKAIMTELVNNGYIDFNGRLEEGNDYVEIHGVLETMFTGQPDAGKKVFSVMNVLNSACGTRWLSKNVRNKNYGLFTIKNAVGTFVFYGDKEAFLLEDPDIAPVFISDRLFNADTLFQSQSFVSDGAGIDSKGSATLYANLIADGYLTEDGLLVRGTTLAELRKDLNAMMEGQPGALDKVEVALDVLANSPKFSVNDFVSIAAGIDLTGATNLVSQLINYAYLDKSVRLTTGIDFNQLTKDLYTILTGQPNIDVKVRFVVGVLYHFSYPSSIGFFLSKEDTTFSCEYNFKATRLTTGAIHNLSARIFSGGIDKLLTLESQQIPLDPELPFDRFGFTEPYVTAPDAIDGGQVDFEGAYELYYWELFFHAPMYIAGQLKTNQVFDQAEKWYNYIYDPTAAPFLVTDSSFMCATLGASDSQRAFTSLKNAGWITDAGYVSSSFTKDTKLKSTLPYLTDIQVQSVKNALLNHMVSREICRVWQFNPFRNHTVASLLDNITNEKQIAAYNQYPFDPHAIARLRIGAYEKAIVMQYIDNLVKWGDWYFTQYTWESITTANMLYIYAYNILGPKPEDLGPCSSEAPANFADILAQYGENIPQFKITLEDHVSTGGSGLKFQPYNDIDAYFCVPENDRLEQNWDTVIDRLYKINNCLNIAGVKQPLPLFEPPIDPALLARAAASGGNPLSVMNRNAAVPAYRFEYLIAQAKGIASTLAQLGSQLLSALERRDDTALQRLQATQQSVLLNLTTLIKEKQIEQVQQTLVGLQQNLLSAQYREQFYEDQYTENISALEAASLALMGAAIYPETVAVGINGISVVGYLAPNIFGFADGGMKFGDAINAGAQMAQGASSILSQTAGIISTTAQFQRRREDWQMQQKTATYDVANLQAQIVSANAQLVSAQQELIIQNKTIQQENDYENFLKTKFTNVDLYSWLISRLSALYFQTYQLSLDMALAAQSAYQNEMDADTQFIQFDYWDNLHKGLLSGEGLLLSLEQMENTYSLTNTRRLEIEKTVSLLQLDPVAFARFKTGLAGGTQGTLAFKLTEQLFDFDFPGHYLRKIKSVTVSIPAVVGPYQNINATLRQKKNITVMKPEKAAASYAMNPVGTAPDSVRVDWIPNQKIALSRGVDDSGLFVLNFSDTMYLPFEGTGAVSDWELSIPPSTNRFDFSSVSDVIVKISYTAYEDEGTFGSDVRDLLTKESAPYPFAVSKQFVLQQAFSANWYQFLHPQADPVTQQMSFRLTDGVILPNLKNVTLQSLSVVILTKDNAAVSDKQGAGFLSFTQDGQQAIPVPVTNNFGTVPLSGTFTAENAGLQFTIANTPDGLLTADKKQLDADKLTGLVFVLNYTSNVFTKK